MRRAEDRRFGSGKNVNVLTDPWLLDEEDLYVYTVKNAPEGLMVASLMKQGITSGYRLGS